MITDRYTRASVKGAKREDKMKKYLLIMGVLILGTPVHAQDRSTIMKDVTLWYEAFNKKDGSG